MKKLHLIYSLILLLNLSACREDERVFLSDSVQVTLPVVGTRIKGFYQLNEGNMGMNRASLDYFDYIRGEKRNVSICGGPENDRLLWLSKRYGGVGESGLEKRSVYIALHWAYI